MSLLATFAALLHAENTSVANAVEDANQFVEEKMTALNAANLAPPRSEHFNAVSGAMDVVLKALMEFSESLTPRNASASDAAVLALPLADAMPAAASVPLDGLGITDKATIERLRKGRFELDKLVKIQHQLRLAGKDSVATINAFKETLEQLRPEIDALVRAFNGTLSSSLAHLLAQFDQLLRAVQQNQPVIAGLFTALGAAIAVGYIPAMLVAATTTLSVLSPIGLVVSAITALSMAFALVYRDIRQFMAGNDSLIGQFFTLYPGIEQQVYSMLAAFRHVFGGLKQALPTVTNAFSSAVGLMSTSLALFFTQLWTSDGSLNAWGASIKRIFANVATAVASVFHWLWAQFQRVMEGISSGVSAVKGAVGSVKRWFGFGAPAVETAKPSVLRPFDQDSDYLRLVNQHLSPPQATDLAHSLTFANQQLQQAAGHSLNPLTGQAIANQIHHHNETHVQTGDIVVNTQAVDAQSIAREAKNALSEQLKDLGQQNATGVSR